MAGRKNNPFVPNSLSWSKMGTHTTCPRAYYFASIGAPRAAQGAAASRGSIAHNCIEKGITTGNFDDPIFTPKLCTFIAETMLGVSVDTLFPFESDDPKNPIAWDYPDPEVLAPFATEVDLGTKAIKVGGIKILGKIDGMVKVNNSTVRICDWKSSDYSRSYAQLQFYAMLLFEKYKKLETIEAYQYYLQLKRGGEYFDGGKAWSWTREDVYPTKQTLMSFIRDLREAVVLEAKPSRNSCVDAFGGAGCSYQETCPYAWGKAHEEDWDSLDVPVVSLNHLALEAYVEKDEWAPEILGLAFDTGTQQRREFIAEHRAAPFRIKIPNRAGRCAWVNNLEDGSEMALTLMKHALGAAFIKSDMRLVISPCCILGVESTKE